MGNQLQTMDLSLFMAAASVALRLFLIVKLPLAPYSGF
jgi:hypothetical protein